MRTLSTLVKTALSGGTVVARFIVRGFLPGGTYAASDSPMDFVWNNGAGNLTYKGFDAALQITLPATDAQSKINSASIQLSATDPAVLTSLFEADYRGAPIDIALLLFNSATGVPGEELLMFQGIGDVGAITDQAAKPTDPTAPQISTLSLSVTPRTVDLKRSSGRMGNDPDQRLYRDASDGFFKDVAMVALSAMNWGQAGPNAPVNVAPNAIMVAPPNGFNNFVLPPNIP